MIQDIFPRRMNNQYDPRAVPDADSYVLCFQGDGVVLLSSPTARLPQVKDLCSVPALTYLFAIDQQRFFLLRDGFSCAQESAVVPLRTLRHSGLLPWHELFAVMTGKHLFDWYGGSQFCGRCGTRTVHSDTERCMVCLSCGRCDYPRIMPAVIVGVIHGDRLLITHYRSGFAHSALVAGFVEIGETMEEAVAREVMEECGLRVRNIRYYKSQPWGIASDLLAGFYCEVDGDDVIRMDENELGDARFVLRDEIVLQPDDASLTNEMMRMFKEGRVRHP